MHTLEGIGGVRVALEGFGTAVTDRYGRYRIPRTAVQPPRYLVRIRAAVEGYLPEAVDGVLRNDSLSIPTLLLIPLAPPVAVGPDGKVIHTPGGAIVEFPAGAVEQTTQVSVTFTRNTRLLSDKTDAPLLFPSIHIDVASATLLKPVRISIPLPGAPSRRAALPVLIRSRETLRWDSMGLAEVSDDGRFGSFSTNSQDGGIIPDVRTRYELQNVGRIPDLVPTEQVQSECRPGEFSTATTVTSNPFRIKIGEFSKPQFTPAGVEQRIMADYDTEASGTTSIAAGQQRKIVLKIYDDVYAAEGKAYSEILIDGSWVVIDSEQVHLDFMRTREVTVLKECHQQGDGGPLT